MQTIVHDNRGLVEVWLTNEEKKDPSVQEQLQAMYGEYKKKKYMVAVFYSGEEDLYENIRALLSYNKRRSAERNVHLA